MKSVLITGANAGLGKETARQLALLGFTKIYLGCRNLSKAEAAKQELEEATGKQVFEIVQMDLADPDSVRNAVESLPGPVEGLVMNAGGTGGSDFLERTASGATKSFATNILGHVILAEEMLASGKLTDTAVFAGTEVIRGVPSMGIRKPRFGSHSAEEFSSVIDGSALAGRTDPMDAYGPNKLIGILWVSHLARRFPDVRILSMSPGGTTGTNGMNELPPMKRAMFTAMSKMMVVFGRMHRVEQGALRYVEALTDRNFKSGHFYASAKGVAGPTADQARLIPELADLRIQDNAAEAVGRFVR